MKKKSQSSLEFLIILGIGFFFIAILGGVFLQLYNQESDKLDSEQIQNIGDQLISTAEKVYFRGIGNKITVSANFPEEIENMSIHRIEDNVTYLNFTGYSNQQLISFIFLTNSPDVRINCTNCFHSENVSWYSEIDFNGGPKRIAVQSMGDWVSIDFAK